MVSESLKLPAHIWRDYMEGAVLSIDRDYVDELSEIDVPTLILWGEQDALFPREEQERLGDPRRHFEDLPRDRPRGALRAA